jgi:hypothetical protein
MTEPAKKDEAKKESFFSKILKAIGTVIVACLGVYVILYLIGIFFSMLPGPLQMIASGAGSSRVWFGRSMTEVLGFLGTIVVFGGVLYLMKIIADKMTEK